MTLDFFYNNYDLKNLEIKSAEIRNNKLIIAVIVVAYLELIANGYRPELDVNHEIEFTFDYDGLNKNYNNPVINNVEFKNDVLNIRLNDDLLAIKNNNVLVKQKS